MKQFKQRWKTGMMAALLTAGLFFPNQTASAKDVMCLKTNTGQYIEVVRVSMLVIPDGGSTFEIVVRDGEGATGVESITFEKHESDIDLSKYQGGSSATDNIDMTKPVWLVTNTGKQFLVKDVKMLASIDTQGVFEVVTTEGNETGVTSVSFFRGDSPTGIEKVKEIRNVEQLRLLTPVSSQLALSGCGETGSAVVFALDGKQMAEAPVNNGHTTLFVGHLKAGVYVVKVGNKALKFIKK